MLGDLPDRCTGVFFPGDKPILLTMTANPNVVVLILPTKSWIESGYVRRKQNLRLQAVFLQMPLVVFKRARNVGVLKDIENPIVRENVVACELVVGRDVEEEVGRSLSGV